MHADQHPSPQHPKRPQCRFHIQDRGWRRCRTRLPRWVHADADRPVWPRAGGDRKDLARRERDRAVGTSA